MNTQDIKKDNAVVSGAAGAKAPARFTHGRPKPGARPMRRGSDRPADDIEQKIIGHFDEYQDDLQLGESYAKRECY